jgi:adenosine deaminase
MDSCAVRSILSKELPSLDDIKILPKVLLHEHLDGGLRPATIIDIAKERGKPLLPTYDAAELENWFYSQCNSGSLVKYLECFDKTIAVMQCPEDLRRIARECVLDLAEDNVIYAEIRYAPEMFVNGTQTYDDVISSITEGFQQGMEEVNTSNKRFYLEQGWNPSEAAYLYPIRVETLLCSMRQHSDEIAERIAQNVVKFRDQHVVGMDIAGPENGFPPSKHLKAFNALRKENLHFTIHAGEDFGLPSIWEAIQICGSERLGHGVRLIDDIYKADEEGGIHTFTMRDLGKLPLHPNSADISKLQLGRLANYVRDRRITLEVCPTSNLQTGCVPSSNIREHPVHLFHMLRFRVTINTDNRLMSSTTMTRELGLMVENFQWTFADIQRVTINAMKSAFIPFDDRVTMIKRIIKPAYKELVMDRHEKDEFNPRRNRYSYYAADDYSDRDEDEGHKRGHVFSHGDTDDSEDE